MSGKKQINEETLNKVVGGLAETGEDPQANGRCPYCATLLVPASYGYVCRDCGSMFDGDFNQLANTGMNVAASGGKNAKGI